MNEEEKWLYLYTLPCTLGDLRAFQILKACGRFNAFLRGDFGREKVREYFLGPHNSEAWQKGNFQHMLIQYRVESIDGGIRCTSQISCKLPANLETITLDSKDIEKAREFGLVMDRKLEKGDYLFVHGGFVVDYEEK